MESKRFQSSLALVVWRLRRIVDLIDKNGEILSRMSSIVPGDPVDRHSRALDWIKDGSGKFGFFECWRKQAGNFGRSNFLSLPLCAQSSSHLDCQILVDEHEMAQHP